MAKDKVYIQRDSQYYKTMNNYFCFSIEIPYVDLFTQKYFQKQSSDIFELFGKKNLICFYSDGVLDMDNY